MAKVKVTMYFDVPNEDDIEEIEKLEHHAERILDLDSYPEIESVYGVTVETVEEESLMPKINWFEQITDGLRDYSDGDIWSSGGEILVKTESAADAIADMLETLYKTQGEEVLINIGYYDPVEDEKNGELDRYTGWWYVNIG